MKEIQLDDIIKIINKELEYCNKTWDDVKSDEKWYFNNTMTLKQNEEWRDWVTVYLIKELKFPKKIAEKNAIYIDLMYGLKTEG